ANGDLQPGTSEALQQLNQQLEETREELFARHQEWEHAKQNYEARLKSLTEGDATAQKVEQLEQKLNRAVGLLKTLNTDKQNLVAKITTLEAEKHEALAAAAAAAAAKEAAEADARQAQSAPSDQSMEQPGNDSGERIQELEMQLKTEREKNSQLIEALNTQLSDAMVCNKELESKLQEQAAHKQEGNDAQADLSIQLELAKDDLQQAKDEITMLKDANATLVNKSKTTPASPSQQPSPALARELAEAKATIASLESRLVKEADELQTDNKKLQDNLKMLQEQLHKVNAKYMGTASELSSATAAQNALKKKEASMTEMAKRLESELKAAEAAKAGPSAEGGTNGVHDRSEELQQRIRSLEEELQASKDVFSEVQIEAVAIAIRSLLDSSRKDALPPSLADDSILATWNRAKDEVDSYKDGNRSLEDNLSRLRKENLEAQTKLDLIESEKAKELEAVRRERDAAMADLKAACQSDAHNQDDLSNQLRTLKEAEEQASRKNKLLAAQHSLKQDLETLEKKIEEDALAAAQALKERDTVIQDLEREVATNAQLLKTVKEDLQKTTNERNHFQSQHKTLLDRVSNMKSTLGTKLQADMDSINTLRQQIDQLTAQNNDYLHTIKQLEEELMASHDHYEKTSRELEHLRRRLVDIQEDASAEVVEKENLIHELQSRLQREEREREDWETMAQEQRASKDQAVANMRAMERERDAARAEKDSLRQELDRELMSLNNLQTVLEEFQSAKESEIQFALEGLYRQLNASKASLEEYQGRAQAAEASFRSEQLRHLTLDVERARQLEREVKEKNLTIGKLRHDAVIQQGHLTEAMRRLKEENSQNTVDIPLISNLFISFLNIPRGDQKRFEILQLISGVLKFTDEQREQAGLIRKAGSGLGAMTPTTSGSRSPSMEQMRQHPEPKESFIDMWASFLIRESNANTAGNSPSNSANPRSP
ncbi:hypothetical protein BGZ70_001824, partial [Mortierella alpina]